MLSPKGRQFFEVEITDRFRGGSYSNGSVALRGEAQEVFETAPHVGTGSPGGGLASLWARHAAAQPRGLKPAGQVAALHVKAAVVDDGPR